MFSRIKLGKRLSIGFGAILFLLTLVGFFALGEMYGLANTNKMMYEHPFTVSNVVLRVDGDIVRIHRAMKDVALAEDTADIESTKHGEQIFGIISSGSMLLRIRPGREP